MNDFQNPQQEPGMERRLLLVFALTFIVLLISQPLLMKYMKQQPPAEEKKQPAATQPAPAPTTPPAPAAAAAKSNAAAKTSKAPATVPTRQAAAEQETVIENDLYKITFTNRGAQVKSWILKKYDDDAGRPLELINQAAAAQYGYPLSLWTYDEGLRKKLADALYVASFSRELPGNTAAAQLHRLGKNPSMSDAAGAALSAPATVTFEFSDGATSVRKTFHFDHSYVVKVETTVTDNGQPVRAMPAWPAGFGDAATLAGYASQRVDIFSGESNWHGGPKVARHAIKAVSGGATINGPFSWAGPVDQYFGAAFLPDQPQNAVMVTLRNSLEVPKDPEKPQGEKTKVDVLGAAVGDVNGPTSERVFVGPKALNVLEAIQATPVPGQTAPSNLSGMIDFGTYLGFIARPLFLWLHWTQQHWVSNWGWAIVVLTVIINVLLFPLRLTSMKSALKMQKLQPQVNAIKKKYEKYSMRDPRRQEMNQEIAALFKREGANPMGGCIPMLIQFPFLIAFYSMLGGAIELRHAHWLWLHDLSSADPLHILPILIIITTLISQKITPQAGMDPAQQKVMTFMMPVMLGVISWPLSSGLGIYWVASTLISMIQQFWMNRTRFGQEMRAEAEKRARKRDK